MMLGLEGARFVRIFWSSWSWLTSLSAKGSRTELGQGLARAWAKSAAALRTRSVALWVGIETWRGNHSTVSMMRVARMAMHQTV